MRRFVTGVDDKASWTDTKNQQAPVNHPGATGVKKIAQASLC